MDELEAMRAALAASAAVLGTTSPNPAVGAVVLDAAGELAGTGATAPPGGPHAEVRALAQAGERARGGTAVVTLEPCRAHRPHRPLHDAPCSTPASPASSWPAPTPPAPRAVERRCCATPASTWSTGVLADEVARGPLEGWLTAQATGRPFVTWKYAATLDGRSAAADGTSRWITGETARADVHRLRAEVDAVLVGVGTVLADDPQLTVRPDPGRQPLRVVLDRSGRTPAGARVHDGAAETVVLAAAARARRSARWRSAAW